MSLRTTNFDALATAAPLNRDAAVVRDSAGDAWEPKLAHPEDHWTAPPPPLSELPFGVEDLSGRTVGRLTVVRYHGRIGRNGRWLVRCQCGDYELRRSKAILHPKGDDEAACQACDYLRRIKWLQQNAGSGAARAKADAAMLDELAAKSREASHG